MFLLQPLKCNLPSHFNNLPLNFRVSFYPVTVKFKIPQTSQINQRPCLQPSYTGSQTANVELCQLGTDEKLPPYREHQVCAFHIQFLTLTSNPVTTSGAELLKNSNFSFYFCSTVETCVKYKQWSSSAVVAALLTAFQQRVRYQMQSHQKPPRNVAHGALVVREGQRMMRKQSWPLQGHC